PKEEKYFQKVSNILLVSNTRAIEAMKSKGESLKEKLGNLPGSFFPHLLRGLENAGGYK
ncbi:MAG: hypothetical protein UV06_C0008G0001, partial [Candidatus Collierbacteria bacterium GW2011_GWA2_42_17]